ncbi:IS66 family transposase [Teredinibacter franksiae]|uniref:IS66 family transposase n=1 Tax=Teredinibacter franksiae TaxID=2761453 RepID=UPI001625EAC0
MKSRIHHETSLSSSIYRCWAWVFLLFMHSQGLLNTLKTWLEKNESRVSKEGLTWKAISYTLNQWEKLTLYCEQGEIPISNILAENAIRPFCVGRRNWLFSDTPKGANASAIYYSLIETAKANGLEPYGYFKDMLKKLPYAETMEDLEKLLPWNFKCKDVKTP